MHELSFSALSVQVAVRCRQAVPASLLAIGYGVPRALGARGLRYEVSGQGNGQGWRLRRGGGRSRRARDEGELLDLFEADLAVELQRRRSDLFFLHAAVLERNGRALMLVGASGAGKSTLAWALAHHGFAYAGDELAPVDVARGVVHPLPRALCLKEAPAPPYALPAGATLAGRGWRLPARRMPGGMRSRPLPTGAVFFPRRDLPARRPPRRLSVAEAAARLYANALNPLAHPGAGLDAALRLASAAPAFELPTAHLPRACAVAVTCLQPPR